MFLPYIWAFIEGVLVIRFQAWHLLYILHLKQEEERRNLKNEREKKSSINLNLGILALQETWNSEKQERKVMGELYYIFKLFSLDK
jgi:hypothetical protein